jgi:hypothetical protein
MDAALSYPRNLPARPAAAAAGPPPAAVRSTLREGCLDVLLLWLVSAGVLEEQALGSCGISPTELLNLRDEYRAELAELRRLALCGDYLAQDRLAGLLRGRITEVCLAATTPADLARVSRSLRWLPTWVWTAGQPWRTPDERRRAAEERQRAAQQRAHPLQAMAGGKVRLADLLAAAGPLTMSDLPHINRAARRRQAKQGK